MAQSGQNAVIGGKWSRSDVSKLLCALNDNISDIRIEMLAKTKSSKNTGIDHAVKILSNAMADNPPPQRIRAKLYQLWNSHGDDGGAKAPYDLYAYGAFTRTLPTLNGAHAGMLEEVASKVKEWQLDRVGRLPDQEKLQPLPAEALRRSNRTGVRDDDRDPIVCRCGFTHYIDCIHCDRCETWQHLLCYYDTEDVAPKSHLCDHCTSVQIDQRDIDSLDGLFSRLEIDLKEYEKGPLGATRDIKIGPFGFAGDERLFWGPEPQEIRKMMRLITSHVLSIAHSSIVQGVSYHSIIRAASEADSHDIHHLLTKAHGQMWNDRLRHLASQKDPSTTLLIKVLVGVLTTKIVSLVFNNNANAPHCIEGLLLRTMAERICKKNGLDVLRDLERISLLSIAASGSNSDSEQVINEEAIRFASSMTTMLCSMTSQATTKVPQQKCEKATGGNRSWFKTFNRIFIACLKLKVRLALSNRKYEFYSPHMGQKSSSRLMANEVGDACVDNRVVEICMTPAVIEYELGSSDPGSNVPMILSTIFIEETDEQRLKGEVVSPAIVAVDRKE